MQEQIEAKISDWQQGLDQLHAQRNRLMQQLTETDTAIQRNIGAIAGAQELLKVLTQPRVEVEQAATVD
jgi:hypothetical protein